MLNEKVFRSAGGLGNSRFAQGSLVETGGGSHRCAVLRPDRALALEASGKKERGDRGTEDGIYFVDDIVTGKQIGRAHV